MYVRPSVCVQFEILASFRFLKVPNVHERFREGSGAALEVLGYVFQKVSEGSKRSLKVPEGSRKFLKIPEGS